MKRNDIIRMAREAGIADGMEITSQIQMIEHFARLIATAEREACANLVQCLTCSGDAKECFDTAAAYIRARGQQ